MDGKFVVKKQYFFIFCYYFAVKQLWGLNAISSRNNNGLLLWWSIIYVTTKCQGKSQQLHAL